MDLQGLGINGLSESPGPSRPTTFNPLEPRADVAIADETACFATGQSVTTTRTQGMLQGSEMEGMPQHETATSANDGLANGHHDEAMTAPPDEGWVADDEGDEGRDGQGGTREAKRKDKGKGKAKPEDMSGDNPTDAELIHDLNETENAAKAYADGDMELKEVGEGEEENTAASRAVASSGILPEAGILITSLKVRDQDVTDAARINAKRRRLRRINSGQARPPKQRDFFTSLAQYPELIIDMVMYLPVDDFVSLYAISKGFHETVNGHLPHIMKTYAAIRAPETCRVFVFNLYSSLCISDPVGRPDPNRPGCSRMVPSFPWLRMVLHRHKTVRDILACMAREGHRMPKNMSLSLKKMWLTMDIATSARRVQLMHNEEYWTDVDLYNIQMFLVKLDMRFNDPIDGPGDDGLKKLMMGQRGLTPLCKLLKRTQYTSIMEIMEAAVRYCYTPRPEHRSLPIFGIPYHQVGRGHLEGWGNGKVHLYRVDELVMRESVRRNLGFSEHLMNMMIWGYVDSKTKENIAVTEEEKYMSDEEETGQNQTKTKDKGDNEGTLGEQVAEEGREDAKMMDWESDNENMSDADETVAGPSNAN
jgi:hypothetical protein